MSELIKSIEKQIISAYQMGHYETPYLSRTMRDDEVLNMVDFEEVEPKLQALEARLAELEKVAEQAYYWLSGYCHISGDKVFIGDFNKISHDVHPELYKYLKAKEEA